MDVSTKVANQLIDEKQEVYLRGGKGSGDMMSVLGEPFSIYLACVHVMNVFRKQSERMQRRIHEVN